MTAVLVVHGPNLNLLGTREPDIYGPTTLEEINARLARFAAACDIDLDCFQSNAEHELVERIQRSAQDGTDWILINPAGLTHTSVVLRDALAAAGRPFVEVHLSNPQARETFRHRSLISDLAAGTIAGFGADSYLLALQAVVNKTESPG
ncbi:type II 3-dehydroquinate dehydratase [Wenzhouxiangella sp. AB-CW3]|uniref:type II 3-dehydroquinate dehydratase n=1 Tax=Wenzhouxiangella sp. AB-CW3 TaxID=2771012 RepID=UPI00168B0853|nr:type II 3-dehydroquinate dehydratase [Wenzhouxiangella sp. AB-CW3]QOC22959.1 type II 3-dehydroquinate dehydratase [Wenzhouxiangella sp. AB-CW3]